MAVAPSLPRVSIEAENAVMRFALPDNSILEERIYTVSCPMK